MRTTCENMQSSWEHACSPEQGSSNAATLRIQFLYTCDGKAMIDQGGHGRGRNWHVQEDTHEWTRRWCCRTPPLLSSKVTSQKSVVKSQKSLFKATGLGQVKSNCKQKMKSVLQGRVKRQTWRNYVQASDKFKQKQKSNMSWRLYSLHKCLSNSCSLSTHEAEYAYGAPHSCVQSECSKSISSKSPPLWHTFYVPRICIPTVPSIPVWGRYIHSEKSSTDICSVWGHTYQTLGQVTSMTHI